MSPAALLFVKTQNKIGADCTEIIWKGQVQTWTIGNWLLYVR